MINLWWLTGKPECVDQILIVTFCAKLRVIQTKTVSEVFQVSSILKDDTVPSYLNFCHPKRRITGPTQEQEMQRSKNNTINKSTIF